jgi:hypothetical protein
MNWYKWEIVNEQGEQVFAQTLVIVSPSRSTDIPRFFADWLVARLKSGYVKRKNPFNGSHIYVSFKENRAVFFWNKNPKPMFKHIDFLDEYVKNYFSNLA